MELINKYNRIVNSFFQTTKTLEEIGAENNLTKERVRQILRYHLSDRVYNQRKEDISRERKIKSFTKNNTVVKCLYCGQNFTKNKNLKKVYCSRECYNQGRRKYTPEEAREAINRRNLAYYHNVIKHDPIRMKKRREYAKSR